MQRTSQVASPTLVVKVRGDSNGLRVDFDDGVQQRIQVKNPLHVSQRKLQAGEGAGGHQCLELRD
jgi:hypothetical protein